MVSEKVQRQRKSLLEQLATIAEAASHIDAEVKGESHPRGGPFHLSLKPHSGMYLVHLGPTSATYKDGHSNSTQGSITALFRNGDGREYNISISYQEGK